MGSNLNTPVPVNLFNFSMPKENDKHPLITNNLGRDTTIAELVYLGGYFGDVVEQDGIANTETGRINIDSNRIIRTEQMLATETFVVGATLWFVAGGSGAAGDLQDSNTGTDYAAGIITGFGGSAGAHTYVEFRPFAQRLDAADVSAQVIINTAGIATNVTDIGTNVTDIGTNDTDIATNVTDIGTNVTDIATINAEPKTIVAKITSDASTPIVVTGLVVGDEIIAVSLICTAANVNGDLTLEDGDGNDITDALVCAVDKVVVYAATFDGTKSTLPAAGAKIISVGGSTADTRGIMVITYIPA